MSQLTASQELSSEEVNAELLADFNFYKRINVGMSWQETVQIPSFFESKLCIVVEKTRSTIVKIENNEVTTHVIGERENVAGDCFEPVGTKRQVEYLEIQADDYTNMDPSEMTIDSPVRVRKLLIEGNEHYMVEYQAQASQAFLLLKRRTALVAQEGNFYSKFFDEGAGIDLVYAREVEELQESVDINNLDWESVTDIRDMTE